MWHDGTNFCFKSLAANWLWGFVKAHRTEKQKHLTLYTIIALSILWVHIYLFTLYDSCACITVCSHHPSLSTSSISQCRPQYSRWNDANKIWCWTVRQTRKVVIYWKCWLHGWEVKEKSNGRQCELARTFCWVDGIWWQTPAMCHCQIECESSFHLKGELKEGWNRGTGSFGVFDNKRMTEGERSVNELRDDG